MERHRLAHILQQQAVRAATAITAAMVELAAAQAAKPATAAMAARTAVAVVESATLKAAMAARTAAVVAAALILTVHRQRAVPAVKRADLEALGIRPKATCQPPERMERLRITQRVRCSRL